MNLRDFLIFIYEGAFTVFENVILVLPNRDRKTLRLILGNPFADAILPYMISRLFLSQHEEDLNVYRAVTTNPSLSRKVTQIFWDSTMPSLVLRRMDPHSRSQDSQDHWAALTLRTQGFMSSQDEKEALKTLFAAQPTLYFQAVDYWASKFAAWTKVNRHKLDLTLLAESLANLPNLRRINVLEEERFPCVPYTQLQELWPSPQKRSWASLPFSRFLPAPRKLHIDVNGCWRMMDQFLDCHAAGQLEIGSLIIDTYGRGQLTSNDDSGVHDVRFELRKQPFTNFHSVIDGPGSRVPDLPGSRKLTLRIIKEMAGRYRSLWEADIGFSSIFNLYPSIWEHSLEELTLCRVDIDVMIAHFNSLPERGIFEKERFFNMLIQSRNLRKIRFYECWCEDPAWDLTWLSRYTAITEVELHFVISTREPWSEVLQELKDESISFDLFDLTECIVHGNPLEIISEPPDVELVEQEPDDRSDDDKRKSDVWFGRSETIIPWLKGETTDYPLQNKLPENWVIDPRLTRFCHSG